MTTTRTIALATVSLLVIAGCGTDSDDAATSSPGSTPVVTVTASPGTPTSSPSPSPTRDPHPDLADLSVTTQGLLPLTVGEPPATNPGAEMIEFDDDHCYSEELGMTEGDLGRWIATYPDSPFTVGADDDEVYRLDIWASELQTPEGIGIGSTYGDLDAAYPDLVEGTDEALSQVWWIEDEHGYVVFETQNQEDWQAPLADSDEVILMRVLSPMWDDPDWAAASTDNVAGGCV